MRFPALVASAVLLAQSVAPSALAAPAKAKPGTTRGDSKSEEPRPSFAPVPDWVVLEPLPEPTAAQKGAPVAFLLSQSEERLDPKGARNFVRYVVQANSEAGLRAVGNVIIPWNTEHAGLTIHAIDIQRGDGKVDALRKDDLTVIRRELQLESSTLNGTHSVVMPVQGLRAGDRLDVAFSYATKADRLGKTEEIQKMAFPVPIAKVTRRFLLEDGLQVAWKIDPRISSFERPTADKARERAFVALNVEPAKDWKYVPERFKHPLIQVSPYRDWSEVTALFEDKFRAASVIDDKSEVAALAEGIMAKHEAPEQRALAALRLVQDQVRYNAVLLGNGDYTPDKADIVWSRRYGDCKGKTALLLALLTKMGIEAEPALASMSFDDLLPGSLPSLGMLDHVYVRAKAGPEMLYLDGTLQGQRTLDELRRPPSKVLLPVYTQRSLQRPAIGKPAEPLLENRLTWDMRGNVADDVPFEATLILRGELAAQMRNLAAQSLETDKVVKTAKEKVMRIANDDLELVEQRPENADGSYVFKFKGKMDPDWRPVDGMKGNRFELGKGAAYWTPDFDRSDAAAKDLPVLLEFPYWERSVETVMLPSDGRDFFVDAEAISALVAQTRVDRQVSQQGQLVTSTSDFVRTGAEIPAAEALAAEKTFEKISDQVDYIVARKRLKLPD